MGSLDIISAKEQFLQLVDAVGSKYLPTFTIWLDTKLAEYKVNGVLKPDDDAISTQQYPEWISKSLRQNLSFVFAGEPEQDKSTTKATKHTNASQKMPDRLNDRPNKPPRPKIPAFQSETMQSSVAIKQEGDSGDDNDDDLVVVSSVPGSSPPPKRQRFSGIDNTSLHQSSSFQQVRDVETPMPFVQNTFSLQMSHCNDDSSSDSQRMGTFSSSNIDTFASSDQSPFKQSADLSNPSASELSPSLTPGGTSMKQDVPGGEPSQTPGHMGPPLQPASAGVAVTASGIELLKDMRKGGNRYSTRGPHKCNVCQRSFPARQNLVRHYRLHTGESPFACPYCVKRWRIVSNCYSHMRSCHPDKPMITVKSSFPAKRLSDFSSE